MPKESNRKFKRKAFRNARGKPKRSSRKAQAAGKLPKDTERQAKGKPEASQSKPEESQSKAKGMRKESQWKAK